MWYMPQSTLYYISKMGDVIYANALHIILLNWKMVYVRMLYMWYY
jgi:hypothetical protein